MMQPDEIRERIEKTIEDARVEVMDMTGEGDHFRVIVISETFQGMPKVQQHKKVYGALEGTLEGGDEADIHALALKTSTPEEWEKSTES